MIVPYRHLRNTIGKTYTMTGGENYNQRGIIPRTIRELFDEAEKNRDREFAFSVSYLEIYKGYGYDLLNEQRKDIKNMKDFP